MEKNNTIALTSLKIECSECLGICCTALCFSKVDGFYEDKQVGQSCSNLDYQHRCKIYQELLLKNSKGCKVYDCFGAGQRVTKMYLDSPVDQEVCQVYLAMYRLYQMLWYLLQAKSYGQKQVEESLQMIQKIIALSAKELLQVDIDTIIVDTKKVLKKATDALTISDVTKKQTYFQKDLSFKNLDHKDFSMAIMIACNLEGSSLEKTNFLATDLRDTNIKNTDMSNCLFLTQGQINSAIGNQNTRLPTYLTRPETWQ